MKIIKYFSTASIIFVSSSFFMQKPTLAAEFSNFECRKINNNYVTVAITSQGSATHFIIWKTREFSSAGYTPKRRCYAVTNKLKNVIANNGNMVSGLLLTTGKVGKYRVVCSIKNSASECNKNNFLFNISRKNASNPSQLITKMLNFSVVGSTSPIVE